jgi:hypothetical protein
MRLRSEVEELLALVLIVILTSCFPNRSRAAIIGKYELKDVSERITVNVTPNERFDETIYPSSGKAVRHQWHWHDGIVSFVGLTIPVELINKYIGLEDSLGASKRPNGEITTWSLTLENHWGTLVFPVFPDSDMNFRKVSKSLA